MKKNTLEYFMAHAPGEPQDWFKPVMLSTLPEWPPYPANEEFDKARRLYIDSDCNWPPEVKKLSTSAGVEFELTDELKAKVMGHIDWKNDVAEKREEWGKEYAKQKLIQWPLAWAQEQVKQIPKGPLDLSNFVSEEKAKAFNEAAHLIVEQRDQAWKDLQEIRTIIGADPEEDTVDEVRTLFSRLIIEKGHQGVPVLGIGKSAIKIRFTLKGELKVYSNIPFNYFDVDIVEHPDHAKLEADFGKSIY